MLESSHIRMRDSLIVMNINTKEGYFFMITIHVLTLNVPVDAKACRHTFVIVVLLLDVYMDGVVYVIIYGYNGLVWFDYMPIAK